MSEVLKAIETDKAKFIGEGPWVKDSAYQVYEYENKYYTIIVYDWQNKWLMDETLTEIKKDEINKYI